MLRYSYNRQKLKKLAKNKLTGANERTKEREIAVEFDRHSSQRISAIITTTYETFKLLHTMRSVLPVAESGTWMLTLQPKRMVAGIASCRDTRHANIVIHPYIMARVLCGLGAVRSRVL
jgi:hypothetical protein